MAPLKMSDIPAQIRKMENNNSESEVATFLGQIEDLCAADKFFKVIESIVHLEHAANSKRLEIYNLQNVCINVDPLNLTFEPVSITLHIIFKFFSNTFLHFRLVPSLKENTLKHSGKICSKNSLSM